MGGGGPSIGDIAGAVVNPIGAITRAVSPDAANITDPFGSAVKEGVDGVTQGPPEPPAPNMDPRLKAIRDRQIKQARDFRGNLGANKDKAFNAASQQAESQLGAKLKDVDRSSNRRGLYNSGLREGAKAGAVSDSASGLAQERQNINERLNESADQYDKAALESDLRVQEAEGNIQEQLYQRALANRQAKGAAASGIGGAIGSIAGGLLGRK